jgi:ribonuclease P protein component
MDMAAKPHGGAPLGRLTRSSEFQALRRGKRVEAEFGRLQGIARARGADAPFALRFGLIVPKKLGNAPQRNRIKRRLREGLRLAQLSGCFGSFGLPAQPAGLPAQPAASPNAPMVVDIGIFPSGSALAMNFEALVAQLCSGVAALMRKLGRLPI